MMVLCVTCFGQIQRVSFSASCGIAEKFKILICISLPNKRYYCLSPCSIKYFSPFSAIPHLTEVSFKKKCRRELKLCDYMFNETTGDTKVSKF